MLIKLPPKSNTERQRRFRESHPGYFNKYNGRRKAMRRAGKRILAEQLAAMAAAEAAQTSPAPLMLPAPVELPVVPGMNTIPAAPVQPLPTILLPVAIAGEWEIAA